MKCEIWDWDKDKECGLVGKYQCELCDMVVCKKHERESMGECPECPPPMLRKIDK